ncbi:MAG TPA: hypothetical protein VK906_18460 [Egicoccus sp.]|nr:hypothetical protein [Egicoccus sp.]HSK25176.1 hypothetical protein [Egicoccus sp.]
MDRLLRRVTPAIGLMFVLSACGSTPPADDSQDAAVDPAGSTCLEGTEDCVDADLSGEGQDVGGGEFDAEVARRDAASLLGATEEDLEVWGDVRVERKGDEEFMLTMDLVPGRKTVQLDEDADGVYRVTTVTLELADGSTEVFED